MKFCILKQTFIVYAFKMLIYLFSYAYVQTPCEIREQLEGVNSFILPGLAASLYLRSEHLMVLAPCSLLEFVRLRLTRCDVPSTEQVRAGWKRAFFLSLLGS